jgi:glycosyltransferase involved in cell wall biosynthesis
MPDIQYGGRLSRVNRILSAVALKRADRVTAGSGQAAALANRIRESSRRAWGGRPAAERLVWGVDPSLFRAVGPARDLSGAKRVLHIGSLVPIKDQETLLRAMARVHVGKRCVHLHVVGDGPLRARLVEEADRLGLGGSVEFHGPVERSELGAYYRSADVVVISSRHEAQSAVVLEAGLCGTPVVGTAVGLIADLAPHGAVAVPVGDHVALADAICTGLHSRDGERACMSRAPLEEIESLAAHTADSFLTMYARLADMKRAG